MAGKVLVGTDRVTKAGQLVDENADVTLKQPDHPFVSRGGVKLAGALDAFGYDPANKVAADFGASTGGFTDCLLQRGATRVYAIDVGYGQLHNKLRSDERVVVLERTNARHLQADDLAEPVDLVVIDASFIGADKLLPAAKRILSPGGDLIVMVKPQFQVGKERVGKGGVVREAGARRAAVDSVVEAAQALDFVDKGRSESVIAGPKGNQETFVWFRLRKPP